MSQDSEQVVKIEIEETNSYNLALVKEELSPPEVTTSFHPIDVKDELESDCINNFKSQELVKEEPPSPQVTTSFHPIDVKDELEPDCINNFKSHELTQFQTVQHNTRIAESTVNTSTLRSEDTDPCCADPLYVNIKRENKISRDCIEKQNSNLEIFEHDALNVVVEKSTTQHGNTEAIANSEVIIRIPGKNDAIIHKGEKPYNCKVCLKSFTHLSLQKRHMIVHSGKKPFKCKICPQLFSQKVHLQSHLRMHHGEKPYNCKICTMSFELPCILKVHMKIHSGEKPYKCEICAISFKRPCYLKMHMKIHSGEKPYKCESCERAFTSSSNLSRHVGTFHKRVK